MHFSTSSCWKALRAIWLGWYPGILAPWNLPSLCCIFFCYYLLFAPPLPCFPSLMLRSCVYRIRQMVSARIMKEIQRQRKEKEFYFLLMSQWIGNHMHKWVSRGRGPRGTCWISVRDPGHSTMFPSEIQPFYDVSPLWNLGSKSILLIEVTL